MTAPPVRMHIFCATEEDLLAFAAELAQSVPPGTVVFLSGPLGAGKTTLVRGFLYGLGYQQKVKSPTYTLIEPYEIAGKTLLHCDLYRLQHPQELLQLGLSDYLSPEAICLIEWPERGKGFLPQADIACSLRPNGKDHQGRALSLEAQSLKGEAVITRLLHSLSP